MAFCIVVGSQEFSKPMEGYQNQTFVCRNCLNPEAEVKQRWKWFTVCWIPLIPFSAGWHKDVVCPVCRASEDLAHRPDITSGQAAQVPPQQYGSPGGPGGGGGGGGGGYGKSGPGSPYQQGGVGGGVGAHGNGGPGSPYQQGGMDGGTGGVGSPPPQQQPQYK